METIPYEPLLSAFAFYSIVFLVAEISRRLVDTLFYRTSLIHSFLIELIGTATICICVLENGVIIVNYGIPAFFVVNTVLGYLFGALGRGTFGNPMAPVELFYYGEIRLSKFLVLVSAEVLAGYFSWRTAVQLWRYSLPFVTTHNQFVEMSSKACDLNYQHSFVFMVLFELFGAFLLRTVIPKIPATVSHWAVPAFISTIFSFSILYIGDAALDPVVGSTLFYGCRGLSRQWFMLQYWVCPIIGWMAAASIDRNRSIKAVRQSKKSRRSIKEKKQ